MGCRVGLSDGTHFVWAFLGQQYSPLLTQTNYDKPVIQLTDYSTFNVEDSMLMIVLLVPVAKLDYQIGSPIFLDQPLPSVSSTRFSGLRFDRHYVGPGGNMNHSDLTFPHKPNVAPYTSRAALSCASYLDQMSHYRTALLALSPLPVSLIDLIQDYCPTLQSHHAHQHFRHHYQQHPALPTESQLQHFLFTSFLAPAIHRFHVYAGYCIAPVSAAFDLGLSPHFCLEEIPLEPDFRIYPGLRQVTFSGSVMEYLLANLCVEAVQYVAQACADQIEDQVDHYLSYLSTVPTRYHYDNVSVVSDSIAQCVSHLCKLKSPSPVVWTPAFPNLAVASKKLNQCLHEAVICVYITFPQPEAFGALIKLGGSIHLRGAFDQQCAFVHVFPHLVQAAQSLARPEDDCYPAEHPIESLLMIVIMQLDFGRARTLIELGASCGPDAEWCFDMLQFVKLVWLGHKQQHHDVVLPADWDRRVRRDELDVGCHECEALFEFQEWMQDRLRNSN
eukprot:TRINITY_DN3438_c0_g1_i7.p1 TRINITY_DN3438_c0_g1~~TRINITY_DN3438_c0_g1_i7.p1  ORF type:complete len:501 (-),score=78.00 TRINITY_DN3438_c0_g1_i7:75-1577(-)